jgi:transposase-like protein
MPKTRPAYAPESRRKSLDLIQAGRTPGSLAQEYEVTETSIRNWVRQADLDAGRRTDGLTTEERDELNRLRREVKALREEREILKKAAAWFAQETGATPSRRSPS